ncbi:hypothetical protein [Salinimicrobium sp. GXAS 041]|uniref:hypothetical protein n=1 Tax=Salinimicrobium sp. GXAS 041 TaxID=3400806 RepID=UPI003C745D43
MEFGIIGLLIAAVVGFIIGVFVYRNNVDLFAPIASKIDAKFDKLELKFEELKKELNERDSRI